MKTASVSMLGIDDWLDFAFRCSTTLYPELVALVLLVVAILVAYKLGEARVILRRVLMVALAMTLVWCAYRIVRSARQNLLLALLSGENDRAAEIAFREFGSVTSSDELRCLVLNRRENDNVRFYAACLLADRLSTLDAAKADELVRAMTSAPAIRAAFFATNAVNRFHFEFPVPASAKQLIFERLQSKNKA